MDVHESMEALQKNSAAVETSRPPLIPSNKSYGTTHLLEPGKLALGISCLHRSCPLVLGVALRQLSLEQSLHHPNWHQKELYQPREKRPSTPSPPPRASTLVHDTLTEMQLESRKIMSNLNVLWPSTMQSQRFFPI
ncbi:hypothetical protein Acr_00g0020030 [Actinidia rufa]|uniref:Uncharacterized protein n=1 Tax=Actinidia rufa TaxID=165716 RepID=A0A7J0DDN3_9ERIC|nr:hypothetical protein Acr_00g0020030 [Actinidia rufa]